MAFKDLYVLYDTISDKFLALDSIDGENDESSTTGVKWVEHSYDAVLFNSSEIEKVERGITPARTLHLALLKGISIVMARTTDNDSTVLHVIPVASDGGLDVGRSSTLNMQVDL